MKRLLYTCTQVLDKQVQWISFLLMVDNNLSLG